MSDFSWIRSELSRIYRTPHPENGVDLNPFDGKRELTPVEDANGNNELDPQDFITFMKTHEKILRRTTSLFRWSGKLQADNPLQDILSIEAAAFTDEEIKSAYRRLGNILFNVRTAVSMGLPCKTTEERKALMTRILEQGGFTPIEEGTPPKTFWAGLGRTLARSRLSTLMEGLNEKKLNPFTAHFLMKGIFHEMGWDIECEIDDRALAYAHFNRGLRRLEKMTGHLLEEQAKSNYRWVLDPGLRSVLWEAHDDMNESIRLHEKNGVAYLLRGQIKRLLGRIPEAADDFYSAIAIDPTSAEAFASRGEARAYMGQCLAAQLDFDAASKLDPRYLSSKACP